MASQITGISTVCRIVCSGAHARKYQNSASLAFVRGIHRCPVDYPHKGPLNFHSIWSSLTALINVNTCFVEGLFVSHEIKLYVTQRGRVTYIMYICARKLYMCIYIYVYIFQWSVNRLWRHFRSHAMQNNCLGRRVHWTLGRNNQQCTMSVLDKHSEWEFPY